MLQRNSVNRRLRRAGRRVITVPMFEQQLTIVRQELVPKLRSALPTVPPLPGLLGRAALKRDSYQLGDPLPALSNELSGVQIDREHLARYRKLCGYSRAPRLAITYPALLAFAPTLRLMLDPQLPLPVMGQVHLRNRIELLAEFDLAAPLHVVVSVGDYRLTAYGLEWQLNSELLVDDAPVWRATATSLHRCATGIARSRERTAKQPFDDYPVRQQLVLPAELGRRYARVSGDFNPIHLADMTAGMFGFKQAIIHGMWSKARAIAALEADLPTAGYAVDVEFMRPITLPSTVELGISAVDVDQLQLARFAFASRGGRALHLTGSVTSLG